MGIRVVAASCVLLGWVAGTAAQGSALGSGKLERYRLDNGLTVLLLPDPEQSRVAGVVAYAAGSRDDPAGHRGLAHLVEHLTFRGSKHLGDWEANRQLKAVGGEYNAVTLDDHTVYFATLPGRHLPLWLWIESERMAFTLEAMRPEVFEVERSVVENEWRSRVGDRVGGRLREYLAHAAYPDDHPYHHVDDRDTDVGAIDFDAARWFFQEHYRPDNAVLVLVGAFDSAKARELVERYFGSIRAPEPTTPRAQAYALTHEGSARLELSAALPSDSLTVQWSLPCSDARCLARIYVLAELLAGDEAARLPQRLRSRSPTAQARVGIRWRAAHVDLSLSVQRTPIEDPDVVLRTIDQELAAIARKAVEPQELSLARRAVLTRIHLQYESPLSRAIELALHRHAHPGALQQALERITLDDVATTAAALADGRLSAWIRHDEGADAEGELEETRGTLRARSVYTPVEDPAP